MGRIRLVLLFILFGFGLVLLRLFYWQVVKSRTLVAAATDQYFNNISLPTIRGSILASDGSPLVVNQPAYLVYSEPKKIADPKKFVQAVSEIIDVEAEAVESKITNTQLLWVLIKRKIDERQYQDIKKLDLAGLGFEKTGLRSYPESSMAAHLLGFIGSNDNGEDTGYFGVEGYYDLALKGKPGILLQEKDARGLPIILGNSKRISAQNGQTLKLYLDKTVQFIVEDKLLTGMQRYGAKAGLVAIMDPQTGGILASAAYPNYAQADYQNYPKDYYPNPLVSLTYEPGSTFKTVVMAAALNEKVIDAKSVYQETGPVKVGPYLIQTWNNEYHGDMTPAKILEKSSNPGMVFVGQKLGPAKFKSYLKNFGFGEKTGIDLEGEEVATVRSGENWSEIDLATASFGQGISVTPIQMLTAVAVLANGGKLVKPQVVEKLIDTAGKEVYQKPEIKRTVIGDRTARQVKEMMVNAVENGEAKWAKPKGYKIAGKTGTAQIPLAGHYDKEKTIASFVGFAPATEPKFVMLVILQEPSSSPWGSETAAPLFFDIAKELFAYYGIAPED